MKQLILMRHAKAESPYGKDDFQRVLAERGRKAAPLVGAYLREQGLIAGRVLVSAAARTRETCALVTASAGLPSAEFMDELYLAPANTILAAVRKTSPRVQTVMVIGHNPGLAELTLRLADPDESDGAALMRSVRKFPTAAVAIFRVLTPWGEIGDGDGALQRFVTPADLGGVDED